MEITENDLEGVYSPEMTEQDRKILGEFAYKIAEAIRKFTPDILPHVAPKPRLQRWQVVLGIIVSCIAIIGAAWASLHYVVSSSMADALKKPSDDLLTLSVQGVGLRRDVDRLLDKSAQNIIKTLGAPVEDLRAAAQRLQQRRIEIPLQEVVTIGKTLLAGSQSSKSEEQWNAFLAFVGYRSFLNGPGNSLPTGEPTEHTSYYIEQSPGKSWIGTLTSSHQGLPMEQAARFEKIGKNLNEKIHNGPSFLIADGGVIALNDYFLRHVEIHNAEVRLNNNRVILDDVIFINCSFVFSDTDTGQRLAETILNSARINFRSA